MNLLDPPASDSLPLSFELFHEVTWLGSLLGHPLIKAMLPVPLVAAILPALWWMFRDTWRELDIEATEARRQMSSAGEFDFRPVICLVVTAMVLTLQEYYGGRTIYESVLKPELQRLEAGGWVWLKVTKYNQLYAYGWWSTARVAGYILVPVAVWRICFPGDNLVDYGLRTRGFFKHLWIYGVFLAIVAPVMWLVGQQPDFGSYYPFYKQASRSWFDFIAWEAMYWLQFFALEFFFRGWMVGALRRSLGSSAVIVMTVPYCMIHYGKPYLEAHGAIIAGLVLGSLAMKTRSIYSGFLLHISVAVGMDTLSLYKSGALPQVLWAGG